MKPVKAWALMDRYGGEMRQESLPSSGRKLPPILFRTQRQAKMAAGSDDVIVRVEVREVGA